MLQPPLSPVENIITVSLQMKAICKLTVIPWDKQNSNPLKQQDALYMKLIS